MKKNILYGGSFRRSNTNNETKSELNLDKWFQKIATSHKITSVVPCCPCPTTVPVRLNRAEDTDVLEFWDCTLETPAWDAISLSDLALTNLTVATIVSNGTVIGMSSPIVQGHGNAVAVNVTGAVTAAQLARGYITSTSAAAVTITLPTATLLATALNAGAGDRFQFVVDNSAGANTVTIDLTGTGISVNTPAITGGATLTVSVANAVAIFELVFLSGTTAKILRIA